MLINGDNSGKGWGVVFEDFQEIVQLVLPAQCSDNNTGTAIDHGTGDVEFSSCSVDKGAEPYSLDDAMDCEFHPVVTVIHQMCF